MADAVMASGPVQRPRPRLLVGAGERRTVKLAARYADARVTEGAYRDLWGTKATMRDVLCGARERAALLSQEARAVGRDPDAIGRVFLAGFAPGTEAPWASVPALEDIVGCYRELGFAELVFPEPVADEWKRIERIIGEVLPRLSYP